MVRKPNHLWIHAGLISFTLVAAVHSEPPSGGNGPIDPAKGPAH